MIKRLLALLLAGALVAPQAPWRARAFSTKTVNDKPRRNFRKSFRCRPYAISKRCLG
jgi:hypothetical protein